MKIGHNLLIMLSSSGVGADATRFELGAGGSVIANAGFIKQFGTGSADATGVRGLDPTWVSSWGALLVRQFLVYPRSRLPMLNNGTDPRLECRAAGKSSACIQASLTSCLSDPSSLHSPILAGLPINLAAKCHSISHGSGSSL